MPTKATTCRGRIYSALRLPDLSDYEREKGRTNTELGFWVMASVLINGSHTGLGREILTKLLYIHCESNCTVGGVLFLPCFAEGLQCLKVLREFGSGDEDLLIVTL